MTKNRMTVGKLLDSVNKYINTVGIANPYTTKTINPLSEKNNTEKPQNKIKNEPFKQDIIYPCDVLKLDKRKSHKYDGSR